VITPADLTACPWASCGPAALAALLDVPLASLREVFSAQREGRTWTNQAAMLGALDRLRKRWYMTPATAPDAPERAWPNHGLVLVQFRGSWDAMSINHPAQLQRSHWIATARAGSRVGGLYLTVPAVFDINQVEECASSGGYAFGAVWERVTAPMLARGFGKKATGAWWIRAGIEVAPRIEASASARGEA
jgi:hypothetical protein